MPNYFINNYNKYTNRLLKSNFASFAVNRNLPQTLVTPIAHSTASVI